MIEITPIRVEKFADEIPAAISSVGQDDIQLGAEGLGLDESLRQVPGLFLQNRYNFAQDLRASIRGFGARSSFGIRGIRIVVDGIPETLPDGQGSVDGIDLGSAGRIDVIRGPASSLYGNASGGVILVESERGPAVPFAEIGSTLGDYDFSRLQFKAGADRDNVNYLFNLSDTELGGYRDHAEYENTQANLRLGYALSRNQTLLASVHHTDQPVALDPGGLTARQVEEDPSQANARNVLFDAGEALTQTRAGLVYRQRPDDGRDLEARVYGVGRDFDNRLPFEDGGSVALDRQVVGTGVKYSLPGVLAGKSNRLLLGFDLDYQDDDRSRFDNLQGEIGALAFRQDEQVSSLGVFLQNETLLNPSLDLIAGLRYDEVEFDVTDRFLEDGDDSGNIVFDQWSPMLGLSSKRSETTRLYATISTAFETPTTTELANPDGGGFNESLEAQESVNYEIGVKFRSDSAQFEAALFHIDSDNELVPFERPDQPGRTFYENAGASERNGLELAYSRNLPRNFSLTAAYTRSDFRFTRFTDVRGRNFDGNRIPGIPDQLLYADLGWNGDSGLFARWDMTYTGELYADNANETRVDAFAVSNLRFGYDAIVDAWSVLAFLGVNNLFDEAYNNNVRINAFGQRYFEPAPERNAYVGLKLRRNFLE